MKIPSLFVTLCLVLALTHTSCAVESDAGPPVIEHFDAPRAWGDAPLEVELQWAVSGAGPADLACSVDLDGDGRDDRILDPCDPRGSLRHVYTSAGAYSPRLTVTSALGSDSRSTEIFSNSLVFADHVLFPEEMAGFSGARVTPDAVVLTFDSADAVPAVSAGHILWGTSGLGYLRKVTAVSSSENGLVLATEQARLEEALVRGSFGVRNYTLEISDAFCLDDCRSLQDVRISRPFLISQETFPLEGTVEAGFTFGSIPLGDGEATITPSFDVEITIERFVVDVDWLVVLKEFTFQVRPRVHASAELEVPLGGVSRSWDIPLSGDIVLAAVPVGPFVITPKFAPRAVVSLDVEPSLVFKAGMDIDMQAGVSYKRGDGTEAYGSIDVDFDVSNLSVQLDAAEARVALVPGFEFHLFGVLGPFIDPSVYVAADLSADLTAGEVCLEAKGGADVSVGAELDLYVTEIGAGKTFNLVERSFYHECLSAVPPGPCIPGATRPCGECGVFTCRSDGTWSGCSGAGRWQRCHECGRQTCALDGSAWQACEAYTSCTLGESCNDAGFCVPQCDGLTRCTDAWGDEVCPGERGFTECLMCPLDGGGCYRPCLCGAGGRWTDCAPGCVC